LKAAGLKIGLQKSHFCFKELRYLRFIIGGGEFRRDPKKVEGIQKLNNPSNPREACSLLGTAGWYSRFIRNFAEIPAPLTDTLKKSGKFHLSPAALPAIETLKDFSRRFYVQCDVSDTGVGAVLFQLDGHRDLDRMSK